MNLEAAKAQVDKLKRERNQMLAEIEERQGKLPIYDTQITALEAAITAAETAAAASAQAASGAA